MMHIKLLGVLAAITDVDGNEPFSPLSAKARSTHHRYA